MKINIAIDDLNLGIFYLVPFGAGFRFERDISSDPSAAVWDVPEVHSLEEISNADALPVSFRSLKTNMYIGVGQPLRVDGIENSYYYATAYTRKGTLLLTGGGP